MTTLFVANRGEIAVRVARTCRDLGLRCVVAVSEADRTSPATRLADDSVLIGDSPAAASYLNIAHVVDGAKSAGATLLHPGCGFLSENADFADAVAAAGITFVGPSAHVMRELGDKRRARDLAAEAGLPIVPGIVIHGDTLPSKAELKKLGLPLVVKAAHGGGGRGMRVVRELDQLAEAVAQSRRESTAAFGKDDVFVERLVEHARHVEVQILGDTHGTIVDFGTRDCTVQRRHQKLIEEAPAPFLSADLSARIREAARRLAGHVGYVNAGTAEFLVDPVSGEFFFLEMNTRLQVEHPVTEAVCGVDLVALQIRVAKGEPIGIAQRDIEVRGHAIEFRVNAEDPHEGFRPYAGDITDLVLAEGPGIRNDFGVEVGSEITPFYDSMIGKLIVHAASRDEAIAAMNRVLDEFRVEGIPTTVGFARVVMNHPRFREGNHWTTMVDEGVIDMASVPRYVPGAARRRAAATAAPGATVEVLRINTTNGPIAVVVPTYREDDADATTAESLSLDLGDGERATQSEGPIAPMAGTLLRYVVEPGATVAADTTIALMESMKMETAILAGAAGKVSELLVAPGTAVKRGTLLARIES